ncbi:MAG: sulfate adenylyltransferase subunit 1 [Mycobacteriales bacterium]
MSGVLRVATAGSVDDGKSTLIGRLLHDSKNIYADQLDAIAVASRRKGYDETDLALLTDGLRAEREQGITIDVAYRYFATPARSFILADTPGHVQYTRNMVTGASTAQVAIVLVDARKGLLDQSRRHAAIAALLRVRHLVLAVNKLDLVDFSEAVFDEIAADFAEVARRCDAPDWTAMPISALRGDNVVTRSAATPWYAGPPLLQLLEELEPAPAAADIGARLPVQLVIRPRTVTHPDYRGYAGRVEAGTLRVGDPVRVFPSGQHSSVTGIDTQAGELTQASSGRSVVVRLADDLDVSRGDVLVTGETPPTVTNELVGTVCWLREQPLRPGGRFRLRHTTRDTTAVVESVVNRLDVSTMSVTPTEHLTAGDIGRITVRTAQQLVVDSYHDNRSTGAFLLTDEVSGGTVAAGMVEGPHGWIPSPA